MGLTAEERLITEIPNYHGGRRTEARVAVANGRRACAYGRPWEVGSTYKNTPKNSPADSYKTMRIGYIDAASRGKDYVVHEAIQAFGAPRYYTSL